MNNTIERLQIANTILKQLGGRKFEIMTGASKFVALDSGLRFRLPGAGGFTKSGINLVTITLNSLDTYDVSFERLRGTKITPISKSDGVYCDTLRDIFTDATGLSTSL